MTHNYPPLLTIKLDAYSKRAISRIQSATQGAGIVAFLSSGIDIMTLISKKPTKTIKRIYKNDWNDFITRIRGMKEFARNKAILVAYQAQNHYQGMSGENNQNLYFFWKGVLNAFTK
jgi:hypothetical protein